MLFYLIALQKRSGWFTGGLLVLLGLLAASGCTRIQETQAGDSVPPSTPIVEDPMRKLFATRDPDEKLTIALELVRSSDPKARQSIVDAVQDPAFCNGLDPDTDVDAFTQRLVKGS